MSKLYQSLRQASVITACLIGLTHPVQAETNDFTRAIIKSENLPQARVIERDEFLDRHVITSIRISPDGKKLAFVNPKGNHASLWLHDIASGENTLLFTSEIMNAIDWSSDSSHIIITTDRRVASVPISEGGYPQFLIKLDTALGDQFHGPDPESPHHIFVSTFNKETEDFSLLRINMKGISEELYRGKDKIHDFVATKNGPIKFIMQAEKLTQTLYQVDGNHRTALMSCDYDEGCGISSYHAKTDSLYLYARNGSDVQHLIKMDLQTKKITPVHQDPLGRFDIDAVFYSVKTGLPIMAEYNTDYRQSYGLTGEIQSHIDSIKAALQSSILHIKPMADTHWLIIDSNPKSAYHRFFIYHPNTRSVTEPLKDFIQSKATKDSLVKQEELALNKSFWYKASDGFNLQGYVTFPRGVEISEAPMVVVPHGGPWSRTYGSFSSVAQLLANRGYIVFAPNFRASTGFGRTYVNAANRDFGDGRVQDDIIDGVNYLLSQGIGNKDKLAIFGHSFGGFSTMAALAFTPDMFQVGIAGAPPPSLSKAVRYYVKRQDKTSFGILRASVMSRLAVNVDDPDDVKRLYDQSPDKYYFRVKKPLYIVAGEKDRRVNILDVRDYAIRLEQNGVPVGMLTDKNEGHSFRKNIAREAYFYLVENVLAHHLGGRLQPVKKRKLQKYLQKNMIMGSLYE